MWYFRSPLVAFGEEALSHLEQVKGKRAFIVTDAMMERLGFVEQVQQRLEAAGMERACFTDIQPEPDLEVVQRCAEAMGAYGPDWVIGLGGGSAMDVAKSAWFLYERPDLKLESLNPVEDFGLRARARLIMIPTTAGSGSEVSFGVVIKDEQARQKLELASFELLPDIAIVDPGLSSRMPAGLTADTGADALAHAIEGYNSTWSNDFTDGMAVHAVRLIFQYLPAAVSNGDDAGAREHMANAATIAGLVVNNTNIVLAHAFGHSAGVVFHLPHGRITALFLPYVIEYLGNGGVGRFRDLAAVLGLPAADERQAAASLAGAVRDLLRQVGLPVTLEQAGVTGEQFNREMEVLCDRAQMDTGMVMSRRIPDIDEIRRLFEAAYAGTHVDF